jgi:hypothetical protein
MLYTTVQQVVRLIEKCLKMCQSNCQLLRDWYSDSIPTSQVPGVLYVQHCLAQHFQSEGNATISPYLSICSPEQWLKNIPIPLLKS